MELGLDLEWRLGEVWWVERKTVDRVRARDGCKTEGVAGFVYGVRDG